MYLRSQEGCFGPCPDDLLVAVTAPETHDGSPQSLLIRAPSTSSASDNVANSTAVSVWTDGVTLDSAFTSIDVYLFPLVNGLECQTPYKSLTASSLPSRGARS